MHVCGIMLFYFIIYSLFNLRTTYYLILRSMKILFRWAADALGGSATCVVDAPVHRSCVACKASAVRAVKLRLPSTTTAQQRRILKKDTPVFPAREM